jgi:galactokinase
MCLAIASDVLTKSLKEFRKFFNDSPSLIASSPGRLDFLNTHQDYKGLPVVSVAINKRAYIAVSEAKATSRVISLNLCEEGSECVDIFSASDVSLRSEEWFGNYVRSVIITLRKKEFRVRNFNMLIYSEVPIASGLASSAALQVATITSLNELFGLRLSRQEIAELAYQSEHDVMGIPCGRLDQYGSVMGGITLIETKPPFRTKTFKGFPLEFVVLDSGIRHSTRDVHSARMKELVSGLRDLLKSSKLPENTRTLLKEDVYETDWGNLKLEHLIPLLEDVNPTSRKRIVFTLKMHASTILALRLIEEGWTRSLGALIEDLLERECPDCLITSSKSSNEILRLLGGLINYQHVLLRDFYEVSTPELEIIRARALEAGALGVKISGAGMGGSLLALVEGEEEGRGVLHQTRSIVKRGWVVSVDEGARIDYEGNMS